MKKTPQLEIEQTAVPVFTYERAAGSFPVQVDQLFRAVSRSSGQVEMYGTPTSTFMKSVTGLLANWSRKTREDVDLLVLALRRQRVLIDFKDLYISYLGKLIDGDEFERRAERFAVRYKHDLTKPELSKRIRRLRELTELDFSTSDLSEIFQVDASTIESALTNGNGRRSTEVDPA